MHLNMKSWPVLSLLLLYILIINILLTILITPTKCKHHHHHHKVIKKHHSKVHHYHHHHTAIKEYHSKVHHHKHYHEHKIKSYDKNSTLNKTSYNMTTKYDTTIIYSTNTTTEGKTNTSDYYYNGTSGPFFYYSIKETTPPTKTLNYRKAAYNIAGRIVRGIGAIGSANVIRGAIALFQRIRHPWKDKIFGTDPTTKKPIYCTNPLCLSGGSQRGFHHGSYRIAEHKPWLFNRKPIKQITVKILLDSTNKQISNKVKNSEKLGSLTQDSSLQLLPSAPPESALKAYLYDPEQSNTFGGHEQLPYSYHNPWLHYEVGENNHFQSFGKQEHGKIETASVKPKLYYFNPLLYRSRLTNYIRDFQQSFNTSHCHLCKRPLDTNHESKNLIDKNNKHDDDDDDDGLISRLKNDKLPLLSMRRKWYWANKLRNIRNSLLEQLKPEKHPKHIAKYKRSYINLLMRSLTATNNALTPILQSPKYLSIIEKLVSSSLGNQMNMLQSSATEKMLLLPSYKNSDDSEN